MKRILFSLFLLLFIIFPFFASATETNEEIKSELAGELSNFQNALPDYVTEYLPENLLNDDVSLNTGSMYVLAWSP